MAMDPAAEASVALRTQGNEWFAPQVNPRRPGALTQYWANMTPGMSNPPQNERVRQELLEYFQMNGIKAPPAQPLGSTRAVELPRLQPAYGEASHPSAPSGSGPRYRTAQVQRKERSTAVSLPAIPTRTLKDVAASDDLAQLSQGDSPKKKSYSSPSRASHADTGDTHSRAADGHPRVLGRNGLTEGDLQLSMSALRFRARVGRAEQSSRIEQPHPQGCGIWDTAEFELVANHNRAMRSLHPSNIEFVEDEPWDIRRRQLAAAAGEGSPNRHVTVVLPGFGHSNNAVKQRKKPTIHSLREARRRRQQDVSLPEAVRQLRMQLDPPEKEVEPHHKRAAGAKELASEFGKLFADKKEPTVPVNFSRPSVFA